MQTALIFNIQKFSLHDGPGIRTTVFFKGCPLKCSWCHNPESQTYSKQLLQAREKCSGCGSCQLVCDQKAIRVVGDKLSYEAEKCIFCEKCLDACLNNAREIAGTDYTVSQLLDQIERDRPFYEQSKGGVTFSGGEAMAQIDVLEELITACYNRGISVALDTCGYAPFSSFTRIMDKVDIFLYDLKFIDPFLHQKYTGQDNQLILDNLRQLSQQGANINLRLPLIEGLNTENVQLEGIIQFIKGLTISQINLLPYHDLGKSKYERLGREYPISSFAPPSEERMEEIKSMFEKAGFRVSIGG